MTTIIDRGQQTAFRMPAFASLRVTSPRALPTMAECSVPGALGGLDLAGHVSDYRSATVVNAVITDAFWGIPAWSPPRW